MRSVRISLAILKDSRSCSFSKTAECWPARIFGLLTAVIWGVGDFLSRKPSEQVGSLLTSIYVQPIGLALLLLFLFASHPENVVGILSANSPYLILNLLAGVLGFTGLAFLYKGYYSGVMSVVSTHRRILSCDLRYPFRCFPRSCSYPRQESGDCRGSSWDCPHRSPRFRFQKTGSDYE